MYSNHGDVSGVICWSCPQVLLRQNYLVFWVCLVLGTSYSLYPLPALTTIAFLIVIGTMAIWPQLTLENMRGLIFVVLFS